MGGGAPLSQKKTRNSRDSTQNVRTCCYRESMETSRITTTGCTWTGELQTTLHGSVDGAGLLLSQQASTPRPLERWGAASRKSWPRNGRGFSHGVGTPRDPSSSPTSFSQRCWASAGPGRSGRGSLSHGPLGEGTAHRSGGGRRCGRVCLRGQGRLRQKGGGQRRGPELSKDSALEEAPTGRPSYNR